MLDISEALIKKLIVEQFPQWSSLDVREVAKSGHDNRSYHLGESLIVRLPSAIEYAMQVEKELKWLPFLSEHISLPIQTPVAKGEPSLHYPYVWSVNKYLPGEVASNGTVYDKNTFAKDLAYFLLELQKIDVSNAPKAGKHNFFRGGDVSIYHEETMSALAHYTSFFDVEKLRGIWQNATKIKWKGKPVWVHGDVATGNILVKDGKLSGVIDFGVMATGDPACDYVIAWTFLDKESRAIFFNTLQSSNDTINRSKGWALWKALITYDEKNKMTDESTRAYRTIMQLLEEGN